MSKKKTPSTSPIDTESGQDLAQLRDILFGNQAKATDERLTDLGHSVETVRANLTNKIDAGLESIANTAATNLKNSHQAITEHQNNHQKETTTRFDQVEATIATLAETFAEELKEAQQALHKAINDQAADLHKKLLDFQAEARRNDDNLRREMLTLGSVLENQKAGRSELASLLIQVGNTLQSNVKHSEQDTEASE